MSILRRVIITPPLVAPVPIGCVYALTATLGELSALSPDALLPRNADNQTGTYTIPNEAGVYQMVAGVPAFGGVDPAGLVDISSTDYLCWQFNVANLFETYAPVSGGNAYIRVTMRLLNSTPATQGICQLFFTRVSGSGYSVSLIAQDYLGSGIGGLGVTGLSKDTKGLLYFDKTTGKTGMAVSYTHLTLPTIYSV